MFRVFDLNASGFISWEEVVRVVETFGGNLGEARQYFDSMRNNNSADPVIDADEFRFFLVGRIQLRKRKKRPKKSTGNLADVIAAASPALAEKKLALEESKRTEAVLRHGFDVWSGADNHISALECRKVFHQVGSDAKERLAFWQAADTDKDNRLSWDEFRTFFVKHFADHDIYPDGLSAVEMHDRLEAFNNKDGGSGSSSSSGLTAIAE
jgi:hypothetical protein